MHEDRLVQPNRIAKLENYRFTGLDSSLVGAMKSVADYYQMPLSSSWIYGMTGLAFLHVLDENMVEPNGGPPEPDVFRLARNIGLEIDGFHVYAEGDDFINLQAEAWEKAQLAINARRPVFAKNIDIGNQTSVIYALDHIGYYTYTWHTGSEHSEEVIPWNLLGLSQCPCIHCVNDRNRKPAETVQSGGLISLHWANPTQAADERVSFKAALEFVIRLNEQGAYQWAGTTYRVGSRAHEHWIAALERNALDQYFFSLFIEILYEARTHAIAFLSEIKGRLERLDLAVIDELIHTYRGAASKYKVLKDTYPYSEPRVRELRRSEQCKALLQEISMLESHAFVIIKEIYARL